MFFANIFKQGIFLTDGHFDLWVYITKSEYNTYYLNLLKFIP